MRGFNLGKRIEKKPVDRLVQQVGFARFQQLLSGGIRQCDMAIEAGGDQAAGDGLNDVLVQGLQVLQRTAGVFEFDIDLAKLGGQLSGQVSNCQVAEQVHQNDGL